MLRSVDLIAMLKLELGESRFLPYKLFFSDVDGRKTVGLDKI